MSLSYFRYLISNRQDSNFVCLLEIELLRIITDIDNTQAYF